MDTSDRLIQPPPRSSRTGSLLITAAGLVFFIAPFSHGLRIWAGLAAFALCIAALALREIRAFHPALLTLLIASVPLLHPLLHRWPFGLLAPNLLYLCVILPAPRLRSFLRWLRPGRFDRVIGLISTAVVIISAAALFLWQRLSRPDLSVQLASMPVLPVWLYPAAGLGFALVNAALEEFVFRGVLVESFDSAFGPVPASVAFQGMLFGAMHYLHGFPNGWLGVLLAGSYGLMLGMLRRRSQGMLVPWLTHVVADIVIFAILAVQLRIAGT